MTYYVICLYVTHKLVEVIYMYIHFFLFLYLHVLIYNVKLRMKFPDVNELVTPVAFHCSLPLSQ